MSGGSNDMLDIDTNTLRFAGSALAERISGSMDSDMQSTSQKMATIENGWQDDQGATFAAGYQTFSSDTSNISSKLKQVGQFGMDMADKIETTESTYAAAIEE